MSNIISKIKPAGENLKVMARNPKRRKAMFLALVASTSMALSGCGKNNDPTLREIALENSKITYMDELLNDENDMVGIYEGDELKYISFGDAMDLLESRMDLINKMEDIKLKKYDAVNNPATKDNLKGLSYEDVLVLIEEFKAVNKEEKKKIGPQLKYLLDYYKEFMGNNGLALTESMVKRAIKQAVGFSCNNYEEIDEYTISREERDTVPVIYGPDSERYDINGDLIKACYILYDVQQLRETDYKASDYDTVLNIVTAGKEVCCKIAGTRFYCDSNGRVKSKN